MKRRSQAFEDLGESKPGRSNNRCKGQEMKVSLECQRTKKKKDPILEQPAEKVTEASSRRGAWILF